MRATSSHFLFTALLLLGLCAASPVHADVLIKASAVNMPGVSLRGLTARLAPDPSGAVHLQLTVAQADVGAMGWRHVGVSLDSTLQRDTQLRWILDGALQLSGAPGAALSKARINIVLSAASNTLLLDLTQGQAHAQAALPLDQPSHAQIMLQQLPLTWLRGLLGTVWSGRTTGGRLDAELALDLHPDGLQSSGQFTLHGGGFDTPGGTLAAQQLGASGSYKLDTSDKPVQLELDGNLRGGQLLLGPLYAQLPGHAVQLGLHADLRGGAVDINRLRIDDRDALQLDGALAFDAKGNLKSMRMARIQATFPAAYVRYGKTWLSTLGLPGMSIAGQLEASIDLRADGLRGFSFNTTNLQMSNASGSLAATGLNGGMDWSLAGTQAPTSLGWRSLHLFGIPNGAARAAWRSHNGSLSLLSPLVVPVLKGHLTVSTLNWRPAALKGQRLDTSMVLTGVDMSEFSKAMGWPAFPGTLAGAIPSLRWVDHRFELDGGLSAHLFDGFVDVTRMTLQQPFGSSPVLTANVRLNQLDLAAITSVFNFGSIIGRLHGEVDDLRLVDWTPVAFKASLLADSGGRISQRAVNNLTSVGGGGVAGGLQGAVLKLFKSFSYKRIGLSCQLQGSVCQMGGLEPAADGYTIVEGSGLPYLHVIGHERRVDWPTLVRRLKAAIAGAPPVVR